MTDQYSDIQTGASLRAVSLKRHQNEILRNVDFDAPAGCVTVLFGPSGAGKTTCLRLIAGFERPSQGKIFLQGQEVSSPHHEISPRQRRVGFCFQEDALWPALSVRDHLTVTLSSQYGDRAWIDLQAQELLNRFGLTSLARRMPANLSGGEKKRLSLARALAVNPGVLLLDEPLSSLDGPARDDLIAYLKTCRHEKRAVLLVTHQLEEAFALGDRLVILVDGQVLQKGSLHEVSLHPQNRQAACLLGYRNFFPVQIQGGQAVSDFGVWPMKETLPSHATAASFAQDFLAEPQDQGIAVVESCWPEMRHFRLHVRYKNEKFEAFAMQEISSGRCVSLRVQHPPALFKEAP